MADSIAHGAGASEGRTFHRGLYTLFFTEMWERFSYYGMRALLVLFMVDAIQSDGNGGLGMDEMTAGAIYGLYTAGVYLLALPGGWIADRLLGAQRSVWYGGIIIMSGHIVLAIPAEKTFYLGLLLVVLGTGLLKPNISAIVGQLYPEGGARRDAAFSFFYMGINVGAFLGPLFCSYLGEQINWHLGFGTAAVGMFFGLIQFRLTSKHLGDAGLRPHHKDDSDVTGDKKEKGWYVVWGVVAIIAALYLTGISGLIDFNAVTIAQWGTRVIMSVAVLYFLYMFTLAKLNTVEKKRIVVIIVLFIASALFWSGFAQAGSSLNLFADRYTDRMLGAFGFEIPAGWYQSINPIFIIALAPVFGWFWIVLARRNLNPSIPMKFALGLIQLGAGFFVMVIASKIVLGGAMAGSGWLIMTYLLHTMGELCLSPVGLSSVTKLSPQRYVGQMMGIWFLATALGNLIAGLVAGHFDDQAVDQMPDLFMQVVQYTVIPGVILLLLAKPIHKLTGGIK